MRSSSGDGSPASVAAPIRVYLAEDHPVFRDAVAFAIRSDAGFDLVGVGDDGRTALDQIRELEPDVAIVDHGMPSLDGTGVLNAIVGDGLATRVLMLSADDAPALVYDVMRRGGAAFLTKASTLADICRAVTAVARGETVIGPDVQSGLMSELRQQTESGPTLTERELQILYLIADGQTGPEISARLFISVSTVKSHVKNILEKLGASDRAAAVAEALRRGIIE